MASRSSDILKPNCYGADGIVFLLVSNRCINVTRCGVPYCRRKIGGTKFYDPCLCSPINFWYLRYMYIYEVHAGI